MYYIAKAKDRDGMAAQRADLHPRHVTHLDRATDDPRVVVSGPLVDDDGTPEGSFFIYEASSLQVVQNFLDQDPFARNNVWASSEVHAFDWRRGKPPT